MKKGKFITIEGSEGVGKSTNIRFIQEFFQKKNIELITTREPGGTPLAETIRELLLAKRDEAMEEKTELLLMFAARAQHLNTVILPALNEGKWVLCDRFTDSSYAYQGGGRGLSMSLIAQLEAIVQETIQPDLTLYLDIDVRVGLARASERAELDRFESEQVDFFERVRAAYLNRVKSAGDRFRVVDAGEPLNVVQTQIETILREYLE